MAQYVNTDRREPLTITPASVADYLQRQGMPNMAAMVRDLADAERQFAARQKDLEWRFDLVAKRLEQYEPREKQVANPGPTWTGD